MTLGDLFDVILGTWKVRLQCDETDLDFIAFSNDPIFEPYLNRTVRYIQKGVQILKSVHYEINITII